MQALAFLAVFVYATHATQAIAFEWKPGFIMPLSNGSTNEFARILSIIRVFDQVNARRYISS